MNSDFAYSSNPHTSYTESPVKQRPSRGMAIVRTLVLLVAIVVISFLVWIALLVLSPKNDAELVQADEYYQKFCAAGMQNVEVQETLVHPFTGQEVTITKWQCQ